MDIKAMYRDAAQVAYNDGVDPADDEQLAEWINNNCQYREETLFFLVLGIGSELADIQAQAEGFKDQGDKARHNMQINT